jgi:hypothetical protein
LGSTLTHFAIKMGGPIGQLCVHGDPCFNFAISRGKRSAQDCAAVDHIRELIKQAVKCTGNRMENAATAILDEAPDSPSLLILDRPDTDIGDDQKQALLQLGFHLAGAYYQYCESEPA